MGRQKKEMNLKQWDQLRLQALQRDQYECQKCTKKVGLLIHHKISRSEGGLNVLGNLVTLCRKCHATIEPRMKKTRIGRLTTIQASHRLKKELAELGRKGESYDSVIWRLIKFYREGNQ